MSNIKEFEGHSKPRLYVPVNLVLEYGRHVARLRRRRRRRAYVPTSNTASHDNYQKINSYSRVSFPFPYEYGAPLGGPLARPSSAINTLKYPKFIVCLVCVNSLLMSAG